MADAAVADTPAAEVKGKPAESRPEEKPAAPATPATPEKPAGEKPATEKPATPAAEPARKDGTPEEKPKPPETYALTVPEGSRVDDDDRTQIEQMAKTAGWSNDDAQAALDELHTQLDAQATRWMDQTKADRDYGGEHLEESQRFAKLAIDRLRPPGHARRESFLRFLNKGGAGNHLEVVAFLADLGKAMGEDSPAAGISGGRPAGFDPATFFNHPSSAKHRKP